MGTTVLKKSAERVIEEARVVASTRSAFDIFLSHSIQDKELVIGTQRVLERSGKSVYVDWLVDPNLDRTKVSGATADKLRTRMRQCKSLMFLYSRNSKSSRWMPWELGYFDGYNGNVAILPIIPDGGTLDFGNEEYLQLYPKVDFVNLSTTPAPYINKRKGLEIGGSYKSLNEWQSGTDKLRPSA